MLNSPLRRAGFTLLELLISLFVLGLAVFGCALLFRTTADAINKGKDELIAMNLAQDLREEIRSVSFHDQAPNAVFGIEEDERNQPRIAFDDVDDYEGLIEYPPKDPYGTILSGFEKYRRTVRVQSVAFSSDHNLIPAGPGGFAKLVTIEVFKIDDPAKLTGFPPLVRLQSLEVISKPDIFYPYRDFPFTNP